MNEKMFILCSQLIVLPLNLFYNNLTGLCGFLAWGEVVIILRKYGGI